MREEFALATASNMLDITDLSHLELSESVGGIYSAIGRHGRGKAARGSGVAEKRLDLSVGILPLGFGEELLDESLLIAVGMDR
jgi:hypothetical protein